MRILETLTSQEKTQILNGTASGIFPTMILSTDSFYNLINSLALEYYFSYSAEKTASPLVERLFGFSDLQSTPNSMIGSMIRAKYIDKWERIYTALLSTNYDPLKDYDVDDTKNSTGKDTTTYNSKVEKDGNNQNKTSFASTIEDDGNTASKETVTRNNLNGNNVYGFNSSVAVGDSETIENSTEISVSSPEENTSYNMRTKGGDDTVDITIDESEQKTGTDTIDKTFGEISNRKGRMTSAQSLIETELNLRDTRIFFDIIYRDIDNITALQIYI